MSVDSEEKVIKVTVESEDSEINTDSEQVFEEVDTIVDIQPQSDSSSTGGSGDADNGVKLDASFLSRDVDFDTAERSSGVSQIEFERVKRESAENHDRYIRALADFDNFRKRATKERSELLKYQGEKILADLIEVLDNLELALQHKDSDAETLRTGLEMIQKQFVATLARWEIKSETALGQDFNPMQQNAISKVPVAGDTKAGVVVGELKKTYFYKDKLLRFGEVVVSEAPAGNVAAEDSDSNREGTPE